MRHLIPVLVMTAACEGNLDADRPIDTDEPASQINLLDVSINPSPIDFGSVPTQMSLSERVVVRNFSGVDLRIEDVLIEPAGEAVSLPMKIHNDIAYGLVVAPGDMYAFNITIEASSTGDYDGTIEFELNGGARKSARILATMGDGID